MTQMASGGTMPAPAETETDDLVELRRRLIDRPLQVPELGQLKPAASPRSKRDGWIRFSSLSLSSSRRTRPGSGAFFVRT